MSNEFDVNQYWLKRGRTYMQEQRLALDYHRIQERFLFEALSSSKLPMNRILELGCGFGRITRLLAERFPGAEITAVDLSPDQIENAKRHCGNSRNITFAPYDFYAGLPLPGGAYDATIAIEVLLHHPRPLLLNLLEKIFAVSEVLVNIDWSEDWPWETPEHVWVHDYRALYKAAGLECATLPLPEKVEGMQQKLFIAAKRLSPELKRLEQSLPGSEESKPACSSDADREANWSAQVQSAIEDIRDATTPWSTLILVNDEQWDGERAFADRRILPFLERAGQYWGPPPDDAKAIRELERLKEAGANYFVVAWNSFWWLEHYNGLRQHLEKTFSRVFANERLIIFKLG